MSVAVVLGYIFFFAMMVLICFFFNRTHSVSPGPELPMAQEVEMASIALNF